MSQLSRIIKGHAEARTLQYTNFYWCHDCKWKIPYYAAGYHDCTGEDTVSSPRTIHIDDLPPQAPSQEQQP